MFIFYDNKVYKIIGYGPPKEGDFILFYSSDGAEVVNILHDSTNPRFILEEMK
jgi:hypothetical protein